MVKGGGSERTPLCILPWDRSLDLTGKGRRSLEISGEEEPATPSMPTPPARPDVAIRSNDQRLPDSLSPHATDGNKVPPALLSDSGQIKL